MPAGEAAWPKLTERRFQGARAPFRGPWRKMPARQHRKINIKAFFQTPEGDSGGDAGGLSPFSRTLEEDAGETEHRTISSKAFFWTPEGESWGDAGGLSPFFADPGGRCRRDSIEKLISRLFSRPRREIPGATPAA